MASTNHIERRELVDLLAQTLGQQKATEVLDGVSRTLRLDGQAWTREDALRALDKIAEQSGIVGITARFAKSRIHLLRVS